MTIIKNTLTVRLLSILLTISLFSCNASEEKKESEIIVKQEAAVEKVSQIKLVEESAQPVDRGLVANNIKKVNKMTELKQKELTSKWMKGTLKHFNLEGGFFGIITENGKKYLPLNLKAEYRKHGAVIQFRGIIKSNLRTIQQWGTPIEIIEVKLLKEGSDVDSGVM